MSIYFLIHFTPINNYKYVLLTRPILHSLRITSRPSINLMLSLLFQSLELFLSSLSRSINDFLLKTEDTRLEGK